MQFCSKTVSPRGLRESTSRNFSDGGQLDLSVKQLGRVFQLLTSQQLSCNAAVSSGSAMGSMMQQFERELQYKCGSDMGNSTESNSAVDGGQ